MTGPFLDTMALVPTGVTVVTVSDGRDDIGATVSAFDSVSANPPIVSIGLVADGYMAEVVESVGSFAVSVLSADQRALAGRFSAEGRPSARHLVSGHPHHRADRTGAIVLDDALAALECSVRHKVDLGDHVVFFADVTGLPEVKGRGAALVRWSGRYHSLD